VVKTPIREAVKLRTEQAESVRDLLEAVRGALGALEPVSVPLPVARAVVELEGSYGRALHRLRESVATCELLPERRQ
jgi:hypothetical protein